MKIEGSDLRVRMTKRMLIDAFLQLRCIFIILLI